eukprot:48141_1
MMKCLTMMLVLISVANAIEMSKEKVEFETCADDTIAKISQLIIDPFPIPVGKATNVTIDIVGGLSEEINSGLYSIKATVMGMNVMSENGQACGQLVECPMDGNMDIQFQVGLEKIAMPLKIHVRADVKNGEDKEIFCIKFVLVVKG